MIPKRKLAELLIMLFFNVVIFVLWDSWDFVILFTLGFVWNWVASQESSLLLENTKRHRFTILKTVFILQTLFLKPLKNMPDFFKFLARLLPAGLFWGAVILFNQSHMPWWAVFLGSLTAELVFLEKKIFSPKDFRP
jgi:hypothetical protein